MAELLSLWSSLFESVSAETDQNFLNSTFPRYFPALNGGTGFLCGSSYYVSVSVGPGSGSGSALVHMTSQQQSLPTTGWESTWSKMAAPRYLLLLVILGFASPALAGFRQSEEVLKSFYKIFLRCTLGEWACTASCVTLGQTSGLCTDEGFLFHSAKLV